MFEYGRELPTAKELIEEIPFSGELALRKKARDEEITKVFTGEDSRLILIIGPCSADNPTPVLEYLTKLAGLQEEVKSEFLIIPRIYTNKPRTKGKGYKGIGSSPNPNKDPDIIAGIRAIRQLHVDAFRETYMPAADEMLYYENFPYLEDILGYVAVGARSVENQGHKHVASGIDVPVGVKNPTSGDIEVMLDAIEAIQARQVFAYNGHETKTTGSKFAHAVLRGARLHGMSVPNYHSDDIGRLIDQYNKRRDDKKKEGIGEPRIIVDVNHENSGKRYERQPNIGKEVLWQMKEYPKIRKSIKGIMAESYTLDGAQVVNNGDQYTFGKSVTDPCMGWDMTKKTVYEWANMKGSLTKH